MSRITLAVPSKGRLMESSFACFAKAGHAIERSVSERGYRGTISGLDGIDVAFLSAAEIAVQLKSGAVDAGVTGEDLLCETIAPGRDQVDVVVRLGFGPANVVVAVPMCWLDVAQMSDLDDVAEQYYATHGRRLRVATKYRNLTRRFFAAHGVTGYRVVDSSGATEGAPAAGLAELIVDITTTGSTLAANHLRVLDDGLILASSAVLAASAGAMLHPAFAQLCGTISNSR
jgi:ATP phosphoribosyltransferase